MQNVWKLQMSTAGYSRMVHDAFSERQQQQGGGWEALDPPGQNDGGMHPPIPPAVDAPASTGWLDLSGFCCCAIRNWRHWLI